VIRLVNVANVVLLVFAWLFALLGLYASLLTGLNPILAFIILFFWTALTWTAYRLALAKTKRAYWRKAVPSLFFALSVTCFNYTFAFFQQKYRNEHGFPRRYYSTETEN
jgi:ABC-type glycerol-3-phosphate transport system permease component